ncbi:MAG: IS200/IS605 family transposase [Gemmataceae bacterium]
MRLAGPNIDDSHQECRAWPTLTRSCCTTSSSAPKERTPFLDADLRPRTFGYLGGIVRELRGHALAVGGVADHVHLLLSLPPNVSVSEALRIMKTNSSRWVHETWPDRSGFAWQTGYSAFTLSQLNREAVLRYICSARGAS